MMPRQQLHNYRIELVRIIDANTFIADIDLGFDTVRKGAAIQLRGVEDSTEAYTVDVYTERLKELIEGQELFIESYGLDGFGRVVATLYDNTDTKLVNINQAMKEFE